MTNKGEGKKMTVESAISALDTRIEQNIWGIQMLKFSR